MSIYLVFVSEGLSGRLLTLFIECNLVTLLVSRVGVGWLAGSFAPLPFVDFFLCMSCLCHFLSRFGRWFVPGLTRVPGCFWPRLCVMRAPTSLFFTGGRSGISVG